MACVRSTLPATFRINGSGKFAADIREELRSDFVSAIAGLGGADADGEAVAAPFPLPWCAAAGGVGVRAPQRRWARDAITRAALIRSRARACALQVPG
jgi:hypothetical protein